MPLRRYVAVRLQRSPLGAAPPRAGKNPHCDKDLMPAMSPVGAERLDLALRSRGMKMNKKSYAARASVLAIAVFLAISAARNMRLPPERVETARLLRVLISFLPILANRPALVSRPSDRPYFFGSATI